MRPVVLPVLFLLLLCNGLLLWRLAQDDVDLAVYSPRLRYELGVHLAMDLVGDRARARVYLPAQTEQQRVLRESVQTSGLSHSLISLGADRQAQFQGDGLIGHHEATYRAIVETEAQRFRLAAGTRLPAVLPAAISAHLQAEDQIQVDHPEIVATARRITADCSDGDLVAILAAVFAFVHEEISTSDFENALDALTTLRWGEAFCGGKSRLLTALLRAEGVPTRLVGGLILEPGRKRVGHLWCEAWINGVWLPLDPVNGHYLYKPAHYLVLYRGDHALTTRTQDINFQYHFSIRDHHTPPEEAMSDPSTGVAAYPVWQVFREARVPLSLLRVLLLLPFAVLVVLIARNLIGLPSFGTFLPALLAMAFNATGLGWGLLFLAVVLGVGILARCLIERLQILHTPRLALILTVVVATILGLCSLAVGGGWIEPSALALYPVIILVCMVEQCFVSLQESGPRVTMQTALGTAVVVSAVYVLVSWPPLEALVFVLPEILLAVIALYLVIGRYVGLRMSELFRFRRLILQGVRP